MLTHKGFSAWICCDGNPITEYLVTVEEEESRVSCWIPGEEGKQFSVAWLDHGSKINTAGYIALDGFTVAGRFLFGDGKAERSGLRSGPNSERPFTFMSVPEDASAGSSASSASKDVGTISLWIKQVQLVGSRPANPIQAMKSPSVLGKRKADELCVGYGEERETYHQSPITWSVKPLGENISEGTKPSTFLTFVFRYRSREFLMAQGIMPTPSARPTRSSTRQPSSSQRAAARRIVSAPSVPTIVTGSALGLTAPASNGESSSALAPAAAVAAIVSTAPGPIPTGPQSANPSSSLVTPSPSPKEPSPKRRKIDRLDFATNGPYRLRRPSDMRRAVSWREPNARFENKDPRASYPGEATINFTDPFPSSASTSVSTTPLPTLTQTPPPASNLPPTPASSGSSANAFSADVSSDEKPDPSRPSSTAPIDFSWPELEMPQPPSSAAHPSNLDAALRYPTAEPTSNEASGASASPETNLSQELEWYGSGVRFFGSEWTGSHDATGSN
ncbi:hypothetical protein HGRIS_012867 [Hohenbuehelia grisea]|uniref:DUF7918 domain-containing protein n=1 Tax=Hohenbuehelia grisea TaxID=104357 RepID=A0ABR3ITT7_9AGAR